MTHTHTHNQFTTSSEKAMQREFKRPSAIGLKPKSEQPESKALSRVASQDPEAYRRHVKIEDMSQRFFRLHEHERPDTRGAGSLANGARKTGLNKNAEHETHQGSRTTELHGQQGYRPYGRAHFSTERKTSNENERKPNLGPAFRRRATNPKGNHLAPAHCFRTAPKHTPPLCQEQCNKNRNSLSAAAPTNATHQPRASFSAHAREFLYRASFD